MLQEVVSKSIQVMNIRTFGHDCPCLWVMDVRALLSCVLGDGEKALDLWTHQDDSISVHTSTEHLEPI